MASHLPLKKDGTLVELVSVCLFVTNGRFTPGCNKQTDKLTENFSQLYIVKIYLGRARRVPDALRDREQRLVADGDRRLSDAGEGRGILAC